MPDGELARLRAIESATVLAPLELATATTAACVNAFSPANGRSFRCELRRHGTEKAPVQLMGKLTAVTLPELVAFGLDRALGLNRVPTTVYVPATLYANYTDSRDAESHSYDAESHSDLPPAKAPGILLTPLMSGVQEFNLATPRGVQTFGQGSLWTACLQWASSGVTQHIGEWELRGERYAVRQVMRASESSPPTYGACSHENCEYGNSSSIGSPCATKEIPQAPRSSLKRLGSRGSKLLQSHRKTTTVCSRCACAFGRGERGHLALPCTLASTRALLDLATFDHLLRNRDRLSLLDVTKNLFALNPAPSLSDAAAAAAHPLERLVYIDQHFSQIVNHQYVEAKAEDGGRGWAYVDSTSSACLFSHTLGAALFGAQPAGWALGASSAPSGSVNASALVASLLGWAHQARSVALSGRDHATLRRGLEQQVDRLVDRIVDCARTQGRREILVL